MRPHEVYLHVGLLDEFHLVFEPAVRYAFRMIADIRKLLEAQPFQPFAIVTSSGKQYRVASPDHAGFNPRGTRVLVWFDDDSSVDVAALHIVSLEKDSPLSSQAA